MIVKFLHLFMGGHESGMRSGTLNVPGIVGLAKAIEVSIESLNDDADYTMSLRNQLLDCLEQHCTTLRR